MPSVPYLVSVPLLGQIRYAFCTQLSSGIEPLISDSVVLGMPSGDEYCAMLEDRKVAGTKVLQGVMVRQATGIVRW